MGRAACTRGWHAARVRHDGGPVAHGHHHAASRGARGRREHQRVPAAAAAATATTAGDAARRRRDGRLHQAAGGRRSRRLGVQEVAPGLRRRHVTVLLVLVLRYAPGQDLRQQLQLYTKITRPLVSQCAPLPLRYPSRDDRTAGARGTRLFELPNPI